MMLFRWRSYYEAEWITIWKRWNGNYIKKKRRRRRRREMFKMRSFSSLSNLFLFGYARESMWRKRSGRRCYDPSGSWNGWKNAYMLREFGGKVFTNLHPWKQLLKAPSIRFFLQKYKVNACPLCLLNPWNHSFTARKMRHFIRP